MSKTQPTKPCCHFPKIGHCWHCDNRNKEVFISQPCPLWNDIKPKPTKLFTEEDVLEILGGRYITFPGMDAEIHTAKLESKNELLAEQHQRLSDKKEGK